jgi:hypothetical protein
MIDDSEPSWPDVVADIYRHRAFLARIQATNERERLIRDTSITDEEFVHASRAFQGTCATWRDYEERVTLRAMREWAVPLGIDPDGLDGYHRFRLCDLHVFLKNVAGQDDIDRLIASIDAERDNRLRPCDKCGELTHFSITEIVEILMFAVSRRLWCPKCRSAWEQAPSTPPAGGIRSALARARAAHLPATLTNEEWTRTLEHFGHRCAYCGGPWCLVEHVTSISSGGPTVAWNCLPSCVGCNATKKDRDLEALDGIWPESRLSAIREWLEGLGRPPRNATRSTTAPTPTETT